VRTLVWGVLIFALLLAGLRLLERTGLYLPTSAHLAHPGSYGFRYEEKIVETADGERLDAWWIPAEGNDRPKGVEDPPLPPLPPLPKVPGAPVILFFHGNGGNISHRIQKIRYFLKMGASVLIFDYRGYGASSGRPDERGTYRDGEAAAQAALAEAGGDPDRVAYYGESLGCAVALETALRLPPRALILDSPFSSTAAMGALIFPWLPTRWIVLNRYDNLGKINALSAPLLLLHSPDDDVIPFSMGRAVYEAAPSPKRFVETRGDHNEGFSESPNWGPSIADFLTEIFSR